MLGFGQSPFLGHPRIHLVEDQAAGVDGSSVSAAGWEVAVLNTVVQNDLGVTLAANKITDLPAGTYRAFASSPAYLCAGAAVRLVGRGAELVVNGDFSSPDGWSTPAPWSISAGVISATPYAVATNAYRAAGIVAGRPYVFSAETTALAAGSWRGYVGSSAYGKNRNALGIDDEVVVASAGTQLFLYAYPSFSGSIDNVSLRPGFILNGPTLLSGTSNNTSVEPHVAGEFTIFEDTEITLERAGSSYPNAYWGVAPGANPSFAGYQRYGQLILEKIK